jgi:hypothetical protein
VDTPQVRVIISQLVEERDGEVDGSTNTAHTLVAHDSLSSLAGSRVIDGDALTAVRVVIATSTHEGIGKGNLVLGVGIDVPLGSKSALKVFTWLEALTSHMHRGHRRSK